MLFVLSLTVRVLTRLLVLPLVDDGHQGLGGCDGLQPRLSRLGA
jgi:hypothetical protein